ncbi:hypothetical protein E2C01_072358 [Portunus trituberculatus]|uniref:Uncharacterized protein n=1 Tax=Portunus trituberculatus TaxID=210409 RepID=A0A5B7I7J4_PORTR|nr:hypothetical protein [Portunus trituberculatus]
MTNSSTLQSTLEAGITEGRRSCSPLSSPERHMNPSSCKQVPMADAR